jgi:hypothetical protein
MNYDFFADSSDAVDILDFIFDEMDLVLYQLYSEYSQDIKFFQKTEDVKKIYDFPKIVNSSHFQLWTPRFKGDLVIRKVELDPKYCKGHTFRYSTEGWGLIQLYFGGLRGAVLEQSHLGHQSEKRATSWSDTNKKLGAVSKWDWKEVESTARKIKYQIHNKMAVKKIGSCGVLKGAEAYIPEKK